MNPPVRLPLLITSLVSVAIGCGTEPVEEPAILDYEATSWQISGNVNADALAEGATLTLVMRDGGIVNGMLFMPASTTGGTDLTEDMAGVWFKRADTVFFNQSAQTFVDEVAWILTPDMLTTNESFQGNVYNVVMTRQFR